MTRSQVTNTASHSKQETSLAMDNIIEESNSCQKNGIEKETLLVKQELDNGTEVDLGIDPTKAKTDEAAATTIRTVSTQQSDDDDEEDQSNVAASSQVTLSQTDMAICRLEQDGTVNEVIGSQSMLSQELLCSSQRTTTADMMSAEDVRHTAVEFEGITSRSKETPIKREEEEEGPVTQDFPGCSQATANSVAMAEQMGLLTQEEDIEKAKSGDFLESQASVPSQVVRSWMMDQSAGRQACSTPDAATSKKGESTASKSSLRGDTPVRESECFGSLLDAVQMITEREEVNTKVYSLQDARNELDALAANASSSEGDDTKPAKGKARRKSPSGNVAGTKRKSSSSSIEVGENKRSRKSQATKSKEHKQQCEREVAKRAAALAEQTVSDPEMAKKLLLSMALVRENPRSAPESLPPRGATVPEGFFWAHYPPLEAVLKEQMAEYYELSTHKCQSAQQQNFNNDLVTMVRVVAKNQGWKFHCSFSDKSLRDRIRCYYKTHIQNAKKRLRTMVRNPTKRANARHLCAHLDLIQKHGSEEETKKKDSVPVPENKETAPEPEPENYNALVTSALTLSSVKKDLVVEV